MNKPVFPVEIRHLDAFRCPFTGKRVDKTRCGLCGAALPLPGDYPMMVDREETDAKVYDCTGDPGSTDEHGKPELLTIGPSKALADAPKAPREGVYPRSRGMEGESRGVLAGGAAGM